ncbi:hypothetical protein ACF061_04665 [Streptomyces sp. NPDC015220]|uniref:hypothetical protein n=1 Tax=Streptomyces sp. NPDC015220 TaxID=3364947 RepID=UPI0037029B2B
MGSLRLTLCAGLLVAGALAPVLAATGAGPAVRGPDSAAPSPPAAGGNAAVPSRFRPAPSASPARDTDRVPKAPGTAHAVTGLVLAAVAVAAVVLLPRALGADRSRRARARETD